MGCSLPANKRKRWWEPDNNANGFPQHTIGYANKGAVPSNWWYEVVGGADVSKLPAFAQTGKVLTPYIDPASQIPGYRWGSILQGEEISFQMSNQNPPGSGTPPTTVTLNLAINAWTLLPLPPSQFFYAIGSDFILFPRFDHIWDIVSLFGIFPPGGLDVHIRITPLERCHDCTSDP